MRKSLFGKVLAILVAVLIVCFSVTGVLLGIGLNRLSADQKAEQLQMVAEKTEQALGYFLNQLNGFVDTELFTNYLESIAENSGSVIWVVRTDGPSCSIPLHRHQLSITLREMLMDGTAFRRIGSISPVDAVTATKAAIFMVCSGIRVRNGSLYPETSALRGYPPMA